MTCGVCSPVRVLVCLNLSLLVTGLAAMCLAQACPWQHVGLHFPVPGSWCPGPAVWAQEMPADQWQHVRHWLSTRCRRAGASSPLTSSKRVAGQEPVQRSPEHPAILSAGDTLTQLIPLPGRGGP